MTTRLATAAAALERAWPELEEVVRVEVEATGALVLAARGGGIVRWFTHDGAALSERRPARDSTLPAAARVASAPGARVLAWRPARRMVVLLADGRVVKAYRARRAGDAARRHRVAQRAAAETGAFRVARLLELDERDSTLAFERLPGGEIAPGPDARASYAALGAGLARFQRAAASELDGFDAADERAVLATWRERALHAAGALPPGWDAALARFARASERLRPSAPVLAHRDLHDGQLHGASAGLAVLDFDLLARADDALDAGNLVAHLRWRALQGVLAPDDARALGDAFLDGLGRRGDAAFEARLAFAFAGAALRLALVWGLRPRWSERATALVPLAAAALDPLVPTGTRIRSRIQ